MQFADIACDTCHHKDCDGSKEASIFELEDGTQTYRCPLTFITRNSAMLIAQWPHYDKGYLPVAGGMLDQTAIYVQAMAIIGSEIHKHEKEEAEKQRRKHGR